MALESFLEFMMSIPDPSGRLLPGTTIFALDLYQILAQVEGNLILSPYSIYNALAKLSAGAAGETLARLMHCLHTDQGLDDLLPAIFAMQRGLSMYNFVGKIQLESVNRLWPQSGYTIQAAFLNTLDAYFSAHPSDLDYRRDPEAARQTINDWAAEHTAGRIQNLFPPGTIDVLTRLVLANAIYFKGLWAQPFDSTLTLPAPFYRTIGDNRPALMMSLNSQFGYAQMDGYQALELPYVDHTLAMRLLLPDKLDGLPSLESRLSANLLKSVQTGLRSMQVKIWLPRYQLRGSFDLKSAISKMGAGIIFNKDRADFSPMTGGKDLYVSAVQHQAFVEVNEEGTEAAAATGIAMAVRATPAPVPEFRADHPFLFLIQERQTGLVLFLGRVVDPPEPE